MKTYNSQNRLYSCTALLFIFLVTLASSNVFCQESLGRISGYVKDSETKEPLKYASVFLSGTSYGCITNSLGHFEIKNIQQGIYKIVCSVIGYNKAAKEININDAISIEESFELVQKNIELREIEIADNIDTEWAQNYRKFEQEFLGEGKNSEECTVVNKEVLSLVYDKKNFTVKGSCKDELIIFNQALGYRLKIILNEFIWSRIKDYGSMNFYSHFEKLRPKDEKEKMKWEENRKKAYWGSLRHFLKSCVEGNFYEEGFRIKTTIGPTVQSIINSKPVEQSRVIADSIIKMNLFKVNQNKYSLFTSNRPMKKGNMVITSGIKEAASKDLYLIITYNLEQEDSNYALFRNRESGRDDVENKTLFPFQNSWVRFKEHKITFTERGLLLAESENEAIEKIGYMAWERVSDLLPLDYEPPKSN